MRSGGASRRGARRVAGSRNRVRAWRWAEIIFERFGAREVHAFDLDPDMIDQAKARLAGYPPERLKVFVGDAVAIDAERQSHDAVFDFGIIHHRLAGDEQPRARPLAVRTFLEHPKVDRFSGRQFVFELERRVSTSAEITWSDSSGISCLVWAVRPARRTKT